jgi:excisionase family DNA binding protein
MFARQPMFIFYVKAILKHINMYDTVLFLRWRGLNTGQVVGEGEQQKLPESTVLLDVKRAGDLLGLSYWQVRGLVNSKELPVVKVGKKFFLRRSTLLKWAERAEETK